MCDAKMKIAHLKGEISSAESYGQMQVRAYELEQERDQLKAQNAVIEQQLHDACIFALGFEDRLKSLFGEKLTSGDMEAQFVDICSMASDLYHKFDMRVRGEPSFEHLVEIQAKAIEDFQTYFDKEYYGEELSQFIEQYAEKLRQKFTDISTHEPHEQEK